METGIYAMSDRDYFADPAVDQSALKKYLESPKAYAAYRTEDYESSNALEFGKAAHSIALGSGPIVLTRPDTRTKAGKLAYQTALAEHDGEDIVWVSAPDLERLHRMEEEISPVFASLKGEPEQALFATMNDVACKGKIDWLPLEPDEDGVLRLVDYKTTGDRLADFPMSAARYGYHIQAAFYMRLYRYTHPRYHAPLGFTFIVQQKTPPYDWAQFTFDEDSPEITEIANPTIDHALRGIAWFQTNHADPLAAMRDWGVNKTPRKLRFPDWKLLELEEEISSWR